MKDTSIWAKISGSKSEEQKGIITVTREAVAQCLQTAALFWDGVLPPGAGLTEPRKELPGRVTWEEDGRIKVLSMGKPKLTNLLDTNLEAQLLAVVSKRKIKVFLEQGTELREWSKKQRAENTFRNELLVLHLTREICVLLILWPNFTLGYM